MYHQKHYTLTGIDLSRQTNTTIPQQINFTAKLDDGVTIFFITEKQQKLFKTFFRFTKRARIMEHQKILYLLNEANDSTIVTREWNILNDQSNEN